MTKAEIKRIEKDTRDISFRLERKLAEFKNTYLADFIAFKQSKLQEEFDYNFKLATNEEELRKDNELRKKTHGIWYQEFSHEYFQKKADRLKKQLDLSTLNELEWINEADKNYKAKFDKLVSRLVNHKVNSYRMKIEFVADQDIREFSFMITDDSDRVIHARVIYACGEIKAPHYRFIVTERKAK